MRADRMQVASTGPHTTRKGWRGRGGRAGNMGFIPTLRAKGGYVALAQSRELLKQMQTG